VIEVGINLEKNLEAELTQKGGAPRQSIRGLALIDTGAQGSAVDDGVAQELGIQPIDVVKMASASEASCDANIYPVRFEILGTNIKIGAPRAMGATLRKGSGIVALIGRDVLSQCTLYYNGPAGLITLSI